MGKSALINATIVVLMAVGCIVPKETLEVIEAPVEETGSPTTPDDTGTTAPTDDTGTTEDTAVPAPACPDLSIIPTAVLLDSGGAEVVSQTIQLANLCEDSSEPLQVMDLILADSSGVFTVSANPPYTIPSGMSITVDVSFSPIDAETRTAFIIVVSNDPDNPNSSIAVVGRPPADADGDGHADQLSGGGDCNDSDATIHPDAEDPWYDGIDSNCDEANDYDADGDGFTSIDWEGDDCDDLDPDSHPGAEDTWYDGIDSDCDGRSDLDRDGDGFDSAEYGGDDCNDFRPAINPDGHETWYDGIDGNCDGWSDFDADTDGHDAIIGGGKDCDDERDDIHPGAIETADGDDNDCDGIIDNETDVFDDDGDGYAESEGDCDDTTPDIGPASVEVCSDGLDNNCDGEEDEPGADGCTLYFEDLDIDLYGAGEGACLCGSDSTYTSVFGTDCDDADPGVNPGAIDSWYDGEDTDCDGWSDYDSDLDGYDMPPFGSDCNDSNGLINPGMEETWYDGIDSNCDGASDCDADGDGHLIEFHEGTICGGGTDCNDEDGSTAPGLAEVRDLVDQDCDNFVDEDFIVTGDILVTEIMMTPAFTSEWDGEYFELHNVSGEAVDLMNWFVTDADGTGFTVDSSLILEDGGFVVFGVNPDPALNGGVPVDYAYNRVDFTLEHEADQVIIGLDARTISTTAYNPSWGTIFGSAHALDPDFTHMDYLDMSSVWCPQRSLLASGDLGTPGVVNDHCLESDWDTDGYTEADGDCNDFDPWINPGAIEACDGFDNDCNDLIDEGAAAGAEYWFLDVDLDGYGDALSFVLTCSPPDGYVSYSTDCDDSDPDRSPGAEEVWYDGIDANCDDWYDFDADFDGYGHIDYGGTDCDDADTSINPGIDDTWYDGIDSDCDGENDFDLDGDGYTHDEWGGEDCDDADPWVNPSVPEAWNGLDDNCVGGRDDFLIMSFTPLVITGEGAHHLGYEHSLSAGDIDGDGHDDLLIGSDQSGLAGEGMVWLLDGAEPWSLIGTPSAIASSSFSGAETNNKMATMSPHQVNLIGTSTRDILVAGSDALGGHAMCIYNGDTLTSGMSCDDADVRYTGANDDYPRLLADFDYDGDGRNDIVYADSLESSSDTGKIYVFSGSGLESGDFSLVLDTDWRFDGRHAFDYAGSQLGGGDLNDDGYQDLLIGAYGDDSPEPKTGSVFAFFGSPVTPPAIRTVQFDHDFQVHGHATNALVGRFNSSGVGDVNGDGDNDLVVSAPGADSVHVFFSSYLLEGSVHETTDASLTITGGSDPDWFGSGLAVSDITGNGVADIIVGAPDEMTPGLGTADGEGHVFLFFGADISDATTLISADASAHFYGRTEGDNFGALIRSGFDMNDDGRNDIAVSAPGNTPSADDAGQVHILLMPPSG